MIVVWYSDLEPATWYVLRITAHNNAGFNVAEYEFATQTVNGGIIIFITYHHQEIFFLIIIIH